MIYKHYYALFESWPMTTSNFKVLSGKWIRTISLHNVSQQIRGEFAPIFYGQTTFVLDLRMGDFERAVHWISSLRSVYAAMITKLEILIKVDGDYMCHEIETVLDFTDDDYSRTSRTCLRPQTTRPINWMCTRFDPFNTSSCREDQIRRDLEWFLLGRLSALHDEKEGRPVLTPAFLQELVERLQKVACYPKLAPRAQVFVPYA